MAPGHAAPIVVREHDDGLAFKIGPEDTLAGDIEVVAIDEAEDFAHLAQGMDSVFDDAEDVKVFSNRDADRLVSRVGGFKPHAVRATT